MKLQLFRNHKGFSLLETIISLAVVAILATAAISTVFFAAKSAMETDIFNYAVSETENYLTCFKSGDYSAAVNFYNGTEQTSGPGAFTYYYNADGTLCGTQDEARWYIVVNIKDDADGKTFHASAYYREGKIIYDMPVSYRKG